MRYKKTNIKIKRRKINLYNKKKSKSRQALSWIITIVAACVLGVVGYGIGKPIVNYFQNREQYTSDSGDSWNSSDSDSSGESSSSDDTSGTSEPVESEPSTPLSTDPRMYVLPEDAAANSASLSSALAAAKDSGCGIIVVTLKDENGNLYYKSGIESVKDTELIQGALTASQICDQITKAGLTPAAKISTLMDSTAPKITGGGYMIVSGGAWLDDYPDKGGKRWLSPFDQKTLDYIGGITEELSSAGFRHIICTNTMYPAFHGIDIKEYLSDLPLSDKDKRVEALWNVVDTAKKGAEKNGAQLWLELDGTSFVKEKKSGTASELAANTEKLKTVGIIADYSPSGKVDDAYNNAKDFAAKAKTSSNGAKLAVLIKGGLSGSALSDTERAFKEADLEIFSGK